MFLNPYCSRISSPILSLPMHTAVICITRNLTTTVYSLRAISSFIKVRNNFFFFFYLLLFLDETCFFDLGVEEFLQ